MKEFKIEDIVESAQVMIITGAFIQSFKVMLDINKKTTKIEDGKYLALLEKGAENAFKILRGEA